MALLGSLKSLRYQPTPPCIEASDWSVAFQAFGTVVNDQPVGGGLALPRLAEALAARVEPEQPLAAHEVAAVLAVGVERAGLRRVGRVDLRARRRAGRGDGGDGEDEELGRGGGGHGPG